MNGTLTKSAPWIEDIITIGALDYTSTFSVTFSQTGLPAGTTWCQTIQTVGSTKCGTSGSSWLAQNGTYEWNVSVESDVNYLDPTLGNSGFLTVDGSTVSLAFNFTDPLQCGGPTQPVCIQHVIVLVLENEPLSAVISSAKNQGGPTEKYLAKTYMGASNFYAPCHPSAPNYLALISGDTDQCGTDSYNEWSDITLADTLSTTRCIRLMVRTSLGRITPRTFPPMFAPTPPCTQAFSHRAPLGPLFSSPNTYLSSMSKTPSRFPRLATLMSSASSRASTPRTPRRSMFRWLKELCQPCPLSLPTPAVMDTISVSRRLDSKRDRTQLATTVA